MFITFNENFDKFYAPVCEASIRGGKLILVRGPYVWNKWIVLCDNASTRAWGSMGKDFKSISEVEAKYKGFKGISEIFKD